MPLDDDDNPFASPANPNAGPEDVGEDGEDIMPDYAMFSKRGVSSKTIRKGEKDFESHGTRAQESTLESSRKAMEDVLSYTRMHRVEAWLRAWYYPDCYAKAGAKEGDGEGALPVDKSGIFVQDRVVVLEQERGSWLKDHGRIVTGDRTKTGGGRTWLLPEEALHVLERGTLDIWWPDKDYDELLGSGGLSGKVGESDPDDYSIGLPLTLEAAYSLLIGSDGERGKISLAKYQVYAHLRRSGYIVLRAPESSSTSASTTDTSPWSLSDWLFSLIKWESHAKPTPPYGPLVSPGVYRGYRPMYNNLSIIPRHKPTASPPSSVAPPEEPFKIFYHVWKPTGGAFAKTNPPPPDFRIAVADTLDSYLPTLEQLDSLLGCTPMDLPNPEWKGNGRMHQRLKHGHRNVLVAIVDAGLVNYMRFAEGAFGEEKVYERWDGGGGARGNKKGGGRGGRGRGRGRGRGGRGRGRGG